MSKNLIKALSEALDSTKLYEIVDSCLSASSVLNKLGYSDKGQYVTIVKDYLIENEIDTSHFTGNGRPKTALISKVCLNCGTSFKCIPRPNKEQETCSRACSNTYFRTRDSSNEYRSKALKVYGCICSKCGYSENILALDVHHKDHDRDNNSIENLEVLCANCHAIHHRS